MATATRRAPSPLLDPELGEAGKTLLDPTRPRKKSEEAQLRPANLANPIERGFTANLLPADILNAKITMAKGRRRTKKTRRGGGKKEDIQMLLLRILGTLERFKQAKELKLRPDDGLLSRQEEAVEKLQNIMKTLSPDEYNDPALRPTLQESADAFRDSQALQKEVIKLPTSTTASAAARKRKTRRKTRK